MRETTKNTLSSPVEFVELDGVYIEDVPLSPGQYTVVEDGRLYYDLASKTKRVKLGGIKVDFCDEELGVTSKIDPETGREIYEGIFDWDGDGIATSADLSMAKSGEKANEGDIFTETRRVEGTTNRFVSKAKMKTRSGHVTSISQFSALAEETYFEENIKITEDVGRYKPSANDKGYEEITLKGKSVTEVFQDIFQVAKQPSISQGNIRFTWTLKALDKRANSTITIANTGSNVAADSNSATTAMATYSVEKGCVLDVSGCSVGFSYQTNPSYTYGPTIAPSSYLGTSSMGIAVNTSASFTFTTRSGLGTSYSDALSTYDSSDKTLSSGSLYIAFQYNRVWSNSLPAAHNNLGNVASPQVKLGTTTCARHVKINTYQQGSFYGFKGSGFVPTASIVSGNDCTSAIRGTGMTALGKAFTAGHSEVTVPVDTTCVIFAVPDGKQVYQIKNTTVGFDHVEGDFVKVTGVKVQDASGSTTNNYTVYYYAPATGAYENATTFVFYYK